MKLDSSKPCAPSQSVEASIIEDLKRRITELEDQVHDMRSDEQALKSLNIVLRHEAMTLRRALARAQVFIDGISSDWGLADGENALTQSKREAEVIASILATALTEKEHK